MKTEAEIIAKIQRLYQKDDEFGFMDHTPFKHDIQVLEWVLDKKIPKEVTKTEN